MVYVINMVSRMHSRGMARRWFELGRSIRPEESLRSWQEAWNEDEVGEVGDLGIGHHRAFTKDGEEAGNVQLEVLRKIREEIHGGELSSDGTLRSRSWDDPFAAVSTELSIEES